MESCFSTRYTFLCRKFVDLEPNVMATIKLFVRKRKLYHKDGKIAVDLETRLRKSAAYQFRIHPRDSIQGFCANPDER